MNTKVNFIHNVRGKGRPQIVVVGNGLERESGQFSWDALISTLSIPNGIKMTKQQLNLAPFPLLYELISSANPAPSTLSMEDITKEERRLACGMGKLVHASNSMLDCLPQLGANHIFTTNYSYCIEKAFYPNKNFDDSHVRSKFRFNLNYKQRNGKTIKEVCYRMHTGYLAKNNDNSDVGIWHIHGECSVPKGVVLGHDRYGRLLSRIETICDSQKYDRTAKSSELKLFRSWPELFLYGDVYIIGFGFYLCEYDLWWLLRRKQRERYADGKVYFYDNSDKEEDSVRDLLIQANGGIINPEITKEPYNYNNFYKKALYDIQKRIYENK